MVRYKQNNPSPYKCQMAKETSVSVKRFNMYVCSFSSWHLLNRQRISPTSGDTRTSIYELLGDLILKISF